MCLRVARFAYSLLLVLLLAAGLVGISGPALATGQPAISEAEAAYLTVQLHPPDARLYVDGELQRGQQGKPLRLRPGKHKIEAKLEGYDATWRQVELASGNENEPVTLRLSATQGILVVTPFAADAEVQIDGKRVSTGPFDGLVSPGLHTVRIVSSAHDKSVEVQVARGKKTLVQQESHGELRTDTPPLDGSGSSLVHKPPWTETPPIGIYAVGYGLLLTPLSEASDHVSDDGIQGGPAGSLRVGYRFLSWAGAEALFQYSALMVNGNVGTVPNVKYALGSARVGGAFRTMLPGDSKVRFLGVLGAGAVWSFIDWSPDNVGARFEDVQGWGGFAQLELGIDMEFSGFLVDIVLQGGLQSTGGLQVEALGESAFSDRVLFTLGPAIGVGYGFW